MTISVVQPTHGYVEINNAGTPNDASDDFLIYTPFAGFNGEDTISYTVTDIWGASATETITVTVDAVNQAPVTGDDYAELDTGDTKTIHVLENDTDSDDDTLSIDSVTQGQNGTVAIDGDDVTYEPDIDFAGSDWFTYTITDGEGHSVTARVDVLVYPAGQWANSVIATTSGSESAADAIGAPDAAAWMPDGYSNLDVIKLGFETAAPATGVLIKQISTGSVREVELLEAGGTAHLVWVGTDPTADTIADLIFNFAETGYDVAGPNRFVGQRN